MSRERVVTLAFCCLSVLLTGLGAIPAAAAGSVGPWLYLAIGTALAAVPAVAALVISRRRPGNVVGALLAAAGTAVTFTVASDLYLGAAAQGHIAVPDLLVMLTRGTWMLLFIPLSLLLLYFPTGALPGPRWRLVPIALTVVFAVFDAGAAMQAGRYDPPWQGVDHPESMVLTVGAIAALPVFLGLLIASAVSVFRRYYSAAAVERHQIRWLQLAGTSVPLTLLLCWLSYLLIDGPDLVVLGLLVMYVSLPVASAIAIVRHDRFDVDRAVVLTTAYGIIAAVLLTVFTAVSAVAGLLVGRASDAAGVLVTALVALALGSARDRLTRRVAAWLHPEQSRVLAAVSDLRRRVHSGVAVPELLQPVLRSSLHDPALRVGYVTPDRAGYVDRDGQAVPAATESIVVRLAGEPVGILAPGPGTPRWLLNDLAEPVAPLMETGRLRLELACALQEAEASRNRLLRAGYAERRRLELDLHDGAQQRLVSLGMSLRLAQRHLDDGAVDLDSVLDGAVAEIGTAVTELRQIAHGLRPSSLDDGLTAALANLTSNTRFRSDSTSTSTSYPTTSVPPPTSSPPRRSRTSSSMPRLLRSPCRCAARTGTSAWSSATMAAAAPRCDRDPGWRACATGSPPWAARSESAANPVRERSSRRCCRAHRDRRGLGAVPRGPGQTAGRRRSPGDRDGGRRPDHDRRGPAGPA